MVFKGLIFVSILTYNLQAQERDEFLKSTIKNYPKIKESILNLNISEADVTKSEGAFDLKLKGETNQRTKGHYDGDRSQLFLEKELPYFNSKLQAGYRESENLLPIYEAQFETLSQGEYFIKAELSLLRNSLIDLNRLDLINNRIEKMIKESELFLEKLSILKVAETTYFRFLSQKLINLTHKELLELSLKQQDGIDKRVKKGDLAEIYRTENLQYIAKRRSTFIKSKAKSDSTKNILSLFYRDNTGNIKELNEKKIVFDTNFLKLQESELNLAIEKAFKRNPNINIYKMAIEQLNNEVEYKRNQASPVLNLKLENSKDSGQGAKPLFEEETKVGLNLEIPIQRRKVESDTVISILKRDKLNIKFNFYKDKLKNYIKNTFLKINAASDSIKIKEQEIKFAKKLERAERVKFFNGDSDLILLNIREQNTINAKIELVKAKFDYITEMAKFKELTLSEDYLKFIK